MEPILVQPSVVTSVVVLWLQVFAEIVKEEEPDLVLVGKQSIDDDANQTGQVIK